MDRDGMPANSVWKLERTLGCGGFGAVLLFCNQVRCVEMKVCCYTDVMFVENVAV
jgi:hypothetical protein